VKKKHEFKQEFSTQEETGKGQQEGEICTKMGFTQSLRNGQSQKKVHQASKGQALEKKRHRLEETFFSRKIFSSSNRKIFYRELKNHGT